ncbi:PIR protein [Plasmodium vivax]|nr:PIR protein [Plasmodium vivax]
MSEYGLDFLELSDIGNSPLKDLPSSKIYKIFNDSDITGSADGNCAGVNVYNNDDGVKKLCKKFEKNSKGLDTLVGKDVIQETRCSYLTYWIYDEIRKQLNKSSYNNHRNSIINELDEASFKIFYSLIYSNHGCQINIEDKFEEWKEEKILYDYFKNCDTIIEYAKDKSKCTDYYNYVNSIKKYYNKKKVNESCCYSRVFECKEFFNCEEKYDPDVILSKLKCDGDHSTEKTAETPKLPNEAESETSNLVNRLGYNNLVCNYVERDENDSSGVARCAVYPSSPNSFRSSYYPDVSQGNYDSSPIDTEEEEGEESDAEVDNEEPKTEVAVTIQKNDKEPKICPTGEIAMGLNGECVEPDVRFGTAVGKKWEGRYPTQAEIEEIRSFSRNYLLGIDDTMLKKNTFRFATGGALSMGVLMTMFVYYKFTPVGSWMSRKFQGKKHLNGHGGMVMHHFGQGIPGEAIPGPGSANAENRRLRVAYHSI